MTTRSILFALAIASAIAPIRAHADDAAPAPAAPTPAQIEQAKKAYGEGKKSFDTGDFPEAIAKFKESYNLSKNAGLLYNIGLAYESAGMKDLALFYYRKFLTDAPADNAQRPDAQTRVDKLAKEFAGPDAGPARPAKPEPHKGPVVMKPPGTYQASDFQHLVVESAPPAKPLDITASVPEDSGWTVTLYFRTAGEGKFTSKDMHWRYKELVARIPAPKMIGTSVQYYIEAKESNGNVVTRSGKSTSPNLVNLEPGAEPRFYPDLDETGERVQTQEELLQNDLDEDPLHKRKPPKTVVKTGPVEGEGGEDKAKLVKTPISWLTPGQKSYNTVKWGLTGAAVVSLGVSVTFYVLAGKQAQGLSDDSTGCGGPPCQPFDSYDADIQKAGKRDQKISNAFLGVGLGLTVVAGIWWVREGMHSHEERLAAEKRKHGGDDAQAKWQVVPTVTVPTNDNPGFSAGAAASLRF